MRGTLIQLYWLCIWLKAVILCNDSRENWQRKTLFLKSWTSCQCGVRGLLTASCFSDSGVPEHRGWLPGSSAGWGWIWWRLLPLPAGQDGHAVLFTEVLLRTLASFDLPTQNSFLLDHLHHGGVSAEPRHLEMEQSSSTYLHLSLSDHLLCLLMKTSLKAKQLDLRDLYFWVN